MIEVRGENIRLDVVHPVYKTKVEYEKMPDGELYPNQKEKLVKEIRVKKWFRKEALVSVEEYVTKKNTIAKNRCIVFDKYSSRFYAVQHNPEDVINHLTIPFYKNQIGFTYDNKIQPAGAQIHQYKTRG